MTVRSRASFLQPRGSAGHSPRSAGMLMLGVSLVCVGLLCGCPQSDDASQPITSSSGPPEGYDPYAYYNVGEIVFLDDVVSNAEAEPEIVEIAFQDVDGKEHPVREYVQDRHVVLVVTRGNTNPVCPYCTTQTARLINRYDDITSRGAEVLVVYPVQSPNDKEQLNTFLSSTKEKLDDPKQAVPFPVLFDIELKGVTELGIRQDLSKPATYLIDRDGVVRFAYVGAHRADRPSVEALIKELDRLPQPSSESSGSDDSPTPDSSASAETPEGDPGAPSSTEDSGQDESSNES